MAGFKLLIVDDEPSMRSAIEHALRHWNRDITAAGDGAVAAVIPGRHRLDQKRKGFAYDDAR